MINVTFVCMGNICRSPMAEAIFTNMVEKAGLSKQFHIDSVGTIQHHSGEPAHPGTRRILTQNNISYQGQSRKITQADFRQADYLVAMDDDNVQALKRLDVERLHTDRILKLLDFAVNTTIRNVPDPYYHDNFDQVYALVNDGCSGLLSHLKSLHNI
ncbi:MAG: low molecular weight protein-tyrosine-phosphatase [Chloroflexota bacterium]